MTIREVIDMERPPRGCGDPMYADGVNAMLDRIELAVSERIAELECRCARKTMLDRIDEACGNAMWAWADDEIHVPDGRMSHNAEVIALRMKIIEIIEGGKACI